MSYLKNDFYRVSRETLQLVLDVLSEHETYVGPGGEEYNDDNAISVRGRLYKELDDQQTCRVYYYAQNCIRAGEVYSPDYRNQDDDDLEQNGDLRYVEASSSEELKKDLEKDLVIWSQRPFDSERAWQIKWRKNIIAIL